MNTHEEKFIRSFLVKPYRERCIAKSGIPRGDLWHVLETKLDDRNIVKLPPNVSQTEHIIAVLQHLTRATSGVRISGNPDMDGSGIDFVDLDYADGLIVSVVPGRWRLRSGPDRLDDHARSRDIGCLRAL